MASKKQLEALLATTEAKPTIRRGQGMRLSTDEATHERKNARSHDRTDARPKRVNRGYKLREDLIKACKRIALEQDRALYEVMEEALEQYLARNRANA